MEMQLSRCDSVWLSHAFLDAQISLPGTANLQSKAKGNGSASTSNRVPNCAFDPEQACPLHIVNIELEDLHRPYNATRSLRQAYSDTLDSALSDG
jgi:hypothetical protein